MQQKEAIVYPLFSMPLMAMSLDIDNDKLLKYIKNITYRSNINSDECYASKSVKILENKKLKKEKEIFLKAIKEYLKLLGYSQGFKILNSWSTKVKSNYESQPHVHTNTWISGVYYTQDNSSIQFLKSWSNTSFFNLEFNNSTNIYSATKWDVHVKKNTLLIFPSELQHKIKKNLLKEDRYSLAFNVLPVGNFNKGWDNEITYN
jgi:uncharacterized protein (TIGR02466 family)|tara:strand:- start:151 stop:762 length:612 start_codon:yes stop_codon:yes gene_type:complete